MYLLGIVLVAEVVLGFILFPYDPPPVQYLTAVVAVVALVWLARRLLHPMFTRREVRVPSALRFGIVGSLGALGFFVVF